MKKYILFAFIAGVAFQSYFPNTIKNVIKNIEIPSNAYSSDAIEDFRKDPNYRGNKRIENFSSSKKIFKKTSYLGVKKEIYCGCDLNPNNKFDATNCGYIPKNHNSRATRIEFEHLVPYSQILKGSQAWAKGVPECNGKKGRACAGKVYGYIEGDLWNLLPSIGELNGLRSDYNIAEISGEKREFGKCDFEIEDRKMEPPEEMKPVIAAAYYYIQDIYGSYLKFNLISGKNEKLLAVWYNKPMPKWACDWSKEVIRLQENTNKYMVDKCK